MERSILDQSRALPLDDPLVRENLIVARRVDETLLHGGCEARVGAGERSITRHGRRWLARDRAYD